MNQKPPSGYYNSGNWCDGLDNDAVIVNRLYGPRVIKLLRQVLSLARVSRSTAARDGVMFKASVIHEFTFKPEVSKMVKDHIENQAEKDLKDVAEDFRYLKEQIIKERAALNSAVSLVTEELVSHLTKMRELRMSITSEMRQIMQVAKDARELHADESSIKKLREFVEICERLTVLKSNGTLDAITDVVLKMGGVR